MMCFQSWKRVLNPLCVAFQALRTGTSIASVLLILAAGLIIPSMGFRAPLALFSCVFIGARHIEWFTNPI